MKVYRYLAYFALTVLAIFAAVAGSLNQDEGWYVYAARLLGEGKVLYRDFFFTQGPAMPLFYSKFNWVWNGFGLLGARFFTLMLGLSSIIIAAEFAKRIVKEEYREKVYVLVLLLLGSNLYHLYYLAIPKTYALSSLYLSVGLLFAALSRERRPALFAFFSGCAFGLAACTRTSLVCAGAAAFFYFVFARRGARARASSLFAAGALSTAVCAYLPYVIDRDVFRALLDAQLYHASRAGFDPTLLLGSLSRLVRWYTPVWICIGLSFAFRECNEAARARKGELLFLAAAFALPAAVHLLAPNPYEDYQVPVMLFAAVYAAVRFAPARMPGILLVLGLTWAGSFGSPLIEKFKTCQQDRFWVVKKECFDISLLKKTAAEIERLDPGGKELLTQDLYLAVETGRRVPKGLEMGPFSYWGDINGNVRGLNKDSMLELLSSAPCKVAALSMYSFAITVPACTETPLEDQLEFWNVLKSRYSCSFKVPRFGQGSTTLMVLERKDSAVKEADDR